VEEIQKRKPWVVDEKIREVYKKIYQNKEKLKQLYKD